jgi:hypothetical protein
MVKNQDASATTIAVDLGYVHALGTHLSPSPLHYGCPFEAELHPSRSGMHSTRLVSRGSSVGPISRPLFICNLPALQTPPNLQTNTTSIHPYHTTTSIVFTIRRTASASPASAPLSNTRKHTHPPHHITHHGYRYASLPTKCIPRRTTLTAYSELAQRLREEQPRALQCSLRVRDHL